MPTFQTITVDITPGAKERPVINASQFDNGRPFNVALTWGGAAYTDAGDFNIEIHIKKPDGNIVTATPDNVVNEVCAFVTTEQMCACHGINECEIVLYDNDLHVGTGNFILDVEKAPDEGGIQSASEIANLASQIAQIVPEVIGDDYYNKTQTDALLANKANISDLPDMTDYYTKTQTDTLLNGKADISTTYTKTEVDNELALKANSSDLATVATTGDYDDLINKPTIPAAQVQSDYTQADPTAVDYIKNKPDIDAMIAAALLAVMPVDSATGNPCSFDTDIAVPLKSLSAEIVASGGGGTPLTPIPIVGHSALNLDVNGDTFTVSFGQTIYCGVYDANRGKVSITWGIINLSTLYWGYIPVSSSYPYGVFYATIDDKKFGSFNILCDSYETSTESNFLHDKKCLGNPSGTAIYITDGNYTDATAFKNSLANVNMIYELATPIEIDVSDISVNAISGVNNISSNGGGDITAQYKVSIQKYIDEH